MQHAYLITDRAIQAAEYTNTFGTVYDENFVLHTFGERHINFDNNLRKVKLVKRRNYKKNIIAISVSVLAALLFDFIKSDKQMSIVPATVAVFSLVMALLITEYKFKFVIFRRYDSTEFTTGEIVSDDAQRLAQMINKKINQQYKASGF